MTQRDEEQLVDARKQFYENAKVETDIVAKLQFIGEQNPLKAKINHLFFSKICNTIRSPNILCDLLDIRSLILLQR